MGNLEESDDKVEYRCNIKLEVRALCSVGFLRLFGKSRREREVMVAMFVAFVTVNERIVRAS